MQEYEQKRGNVWDRFWGHSRHVPTSDVGYRVSTASRKLDFFISQGVAFNPGSKVLECGCGDGEVALTIAKKCNVDVVGVDYSVQACETTNARASERGLSVHAVRADAKALPLASDSIDVAVSLGIIEHDKNPVLQLKELARVIKPEGILVLMTPNLWSFAKLDRMWREIKGTWPIGYQREFSPAQLSGMCLEAGFKCTREIVTLREPTASGKAPIDTVARLDKMVSRATGSPKWGFYAWVFASKLG